MKKSIYIVILLLISNVSFSQYIIPITNGDSCGFSGDGGPAINACVHRTIGICRDAAGNLYFTDYDYVAYGRVRKITAATGKIETIAGGGTATGNNIPATSEAFQNSIVGLCIDNAGNLLVADGYTMVRKVNLSTGIISTVAGKATLGYTGNGGPATAAQLTGPVDVAVDSAGNIYIVDNQNSAVRKITAATGIITTIAGTGTRGYNGDNIPATAAQLCYPEGIYVGKSADLYIADLDNNRIRKIDAATGIITTIAGTGMEGTSGDGGPATAAVLNNPERVTMDKAGNIYFSSGDDRIRRVDATTGIITTYAGNGTSGLPTFDSSVTSVPATATPIVPWGLCFDTCGNLFFADIQCRILAVVPELPVGGVACHFLVNSVPAVVLPTGHWQVYPNPASGSLTVNAPNGSYDITDMLGRTLLQGALTAGEQTIDITSLTPGSYIFTGYTGDTRNYHSVFVKQ